MLALAKTMLAIIAVLALFISGAESAGLLPCPKDAVIAVSIAAQSPAPGASRALAAPAPADAADLIMHCASESPFGRALVSNPPSEQDPHCAICFSLPANERVHGLVIWPLHGPPRG